VLQKFAERCSVPELRRKNREGTYD